MQLRFSIWAACVVTLVAGGGLSVWAQTTGEPADWPRFRGPQADAISPEKGLLQNWSKSGPRLLWKLEGLGTGYSTVSIAGGRLFTMGDLDQGGKRQQFVLCYQLDTRERLWATPVGGPHGDGPRCTPTVDGQRVYAIATDGILVCLDTNSGKLLWSKDFKRDFSGKMMSGWKYSESPLIDGVKVVCTPGGPEAAIVALQKETGDVIWKSVLPELGRAGKSGAGYSSMIAADIAGVRQYVQILGRGAVGIAADDGRFLWGYNKIANGVANIPTPIVRGNHVFVTTSYKTGSALLKLTPDGEKMRVEEVWFHGPAEFENHHGGVVLVGEHLYGGDGQNKGIPVCMEFLTGKIMWKTEAPGSGSAAVLYVDGNLIFRYQNGLVALIAANSQRFEVKGQFKPAVISGEAWAHPVVHDGRLYLRAGDTLMCYDLRNQEAS